jgi:hypothetical protein
LTTIQIRADVEVLCNSSFSHCKSLASVRFELDSKLHRIEEYTFTERSLITIQVPASVEVLCTFCFGDSSVTFGRGSKLCEVAAYPFAGCSVCMQLRSGHGCPNDFERFPRRLFSDE